MNSIGNSSVHLAMDGQSLYINSFSKDLALKKTEQNSDKAKFPNGAQAAQSLEQTIADTKADVQELQKISQVLNDNKLKFSVNKELESVIVTIIDSSTNQVVKEIPSKEIQNLKLRIRNAIGNLFDTKV